MVNIKKQIVSKSVADQRTYGNTNPINYITIHQTGNTNKGADAQAHANIQTKLNPRQASWQYQVDDKEIIQSFDDTAQCWHATDGKGPGNLTSIAIELCINSDGNYKKTLENGAELVKFLLDKYNLGIDKVKQHHDWYNKNCPAQLRAAKDGISWNDFLNMVKGNKVDVAPSKPSTPNKIATTPSKPKTSTYTGDSIIDYLKSIGQDSSFTNRSKLAKQNGISNYSGTAKQNTQLLNKLRSTTSQPKQTTKKGNQTTTSVVDYLKSIGVNSSFANRQKLAAQHGIKNYTGKAAQNSQLLKKLRG